jgi:hypothetical protein
MSKAYLCAILVLAGCYKPAPLIEVKIIEVHPADTVHWFTMPGNYTTLETTKTHERYCVEGIGLGKVNDVFMWRKSL